MSQDYFEENPISCINCIHNMLIESEDINFCLEKNIQIPVGVDYGAETSCQDWSKIQESNNLNGITGGAKANFSGKSAEHVIGCFLEQRGYKVRYNCPLPCKGIWGNTLKVDVFCQRIPKFKNGLIVESKWQDSSGSAFQKIPYAIENIKNCYPSDTILVIDGDYMNKGIGKEAFNWAKQQVGGRLIEVFSLSGFMTWAIENV